MNSLNFLIFKFNDWMSVRVCNEGVLYSRSLINLCYSQPCWFISLNYQPNLTAFLESVALPLLVSQIFFLIFFFQERKWLNGVSWMLKHSVTVVGALKTSKKCFFLEILYSLQHPWMKFRTYYWVTFIVQVFLRVSLFLFQFPFVFPYQLLHSSWSIRH